MWWSSTDTTNNGIYSFMTWNTGRLVKKVLKNAQDIKNLEKVMKIKADFHCFQEMSPELDYSKCEDLGYNCFVVEYNIKNGVRTSMLVTFIDSKKFEIIAKRSEDESMMIVEDPNIPTQKFTRFSLVSVKDRINGTIFHIVNVHLKGGPAGYANKKKLFERLINFINMHAKSGYVIFGGDFNINFIEQHKGDYGYDFLISNGYTEDCPDLTLKRQVNRITPDVPNIKYDYIFFKSIDNKPIKIIECTVITPEKPKPKNFDHYPKIIKLEVELPKLDQELEKQRKETESDQSFITLVEEIERTTLDSNELSDIITETNPLSGGSCNIHYKKYMKYKSKYIKSKFNL